MEMIQIAGIGIVAAVLSLIIKEQKPAFAFMVSLFAGVVIFLVLIGKIAEVIDVLKDLAGQSGIDSIFLTTILKIIGIAYIAEFAAQMTRDAGEEAIAAKIELAGKILIMFMALPIIRVMIETVIRLLPT